MVRGYRALHYQDFALTPLVHIAEIAARQGYDLYSLEIDGKDLHRAVRFLAAAIDNPKLVSRYTKATQDLGFSYHPAGGLNWLEPYYRRFPDEQVARLLKTSMKTRPISHRWTGASTLYFYEPGTRLDEEK